MLKPVLMIGVTAIIVAGCTSSQRVQHASAFADAGINFSDTLPAAIDAAFSADVANNSLQLSIAHGSLNNEQRLDAVSDSNEILATKYAVLSDLKSHAGLLRRYFITLKSLAQYDGKTGLTTETQSIVSALQELNIGSLSISDDAINTGVTAAVDLIVGAYQSSIIKAELSQNGAAIERELALQQAAIENLTEQTIADLTNVQEDRLVLPVLEAFASDNPLPAGWAAKREAALKAQVEVEEFKMAQAAISNLRLAWVALVENRLDQSSFLLLLEDVNRFTAAVEAIQGE